MTDERLAYWTRKRQKYAEEDWGSRPSIFAKQAVKFFPPSGDLLDLGAGLGQDSRYFSDLGYKVTSTDLMPPDLSHSITTQEVDLEKPLPFEPQSFDVIYAHLSLHYFSEARTRELFDEIYDCLRPGGVLAFLVNTIYDPDMNEGEELELNFRKVAGINKRYFDVAFTREMTRKFEMLELNERNTSYKDMQGARDDLISYIGKKSL